MTLCHNLHSLAGFAPDRMPAWAKNEKDGTGPLRGRRFMLNDLSPKERETLVKFGAKGPTANLDHIALNKLFTLGLLEVDSDRRIVLTKIGQRICEELVNSGVRFFDDSVPDIPIIR
jgi:hypothetical protein